MRIRTQAVGGLVVTVAAAVAVAVLAPMAQASGGPAGKPGYATTARTVVKERAGKPEQQDPVLAAAAKRFGLSEARLEQGLRDVKVYLSTTGRGSELGLRDPRVAAVFAKSLGIPLSRAQAVLKYLDAAWANGDKGKPGEPGKIVLPPGAVKFFAKTLHVSPKRAQVALDQLLKLATGPKGNLDPRSAAFGKIAHSLGVSPKRLEAALVALKEFIGQQPPEKGKPAPGKPAPGKPAPGKPAPGKPAPGKPAPGKPAPGKPGVPAKPGS